MTIKCKKVPPLGGLVQIDSIQDRMMARGKVEVVDGDNCIGVRATEVGESRWEVGMVLWFIWKDDPTFCKLYWLREE